MSEDEARRSQQDEQQDEVEAHGRHVAANDEGTSEEESDVEGHMHQRRGNAPRREA